MLAKIFNASSWTLEKTVENTMACAPSVSVHMLPF